MARELTPAELDELLAAYALDAVDAEEREQLDAYLERSPEAAREIAELQETAALLAFTGPDEAPDTLWDRIENALGAEPPRLVMPFDAPRRAGRRAAGAAWQPRSPSGLPGPARSPLGSPRSWSATRCRARGSDSTAWRGASRTTGCIVRPKPRRPIHDRGPSGSSHGGGAGAPPSSRCPMVLRSSWRVTWSAWARTAHTSCGRSPVIQTGPEVVSAGVLGRSLDLAAFHAPEGATGFMVTDEATPGVVTTAAKPVLEGHFA